MFELPTTDILDENKGCANCKSHHEEMITNKWWLTEFGKRGTHLLYFSRRITVIKNFKECALFGKYEVFKRHAKIKLMARWQVKLFNMQNWNARTRWIWYTVYENTFQTFLTGDVDGI